MTDKIPCRIAFKAERAYPKDMEKIKNVAEWFWKLKYISDFS